MARALLVGAFLIAMTAGCKGPSLPVGNVDANLLEAPYRVHPGDKVDVKFEYHPLDSRAVTVDSDGMMNLPVTGDLHVAGLTLREVESLIEKRSSRFLRNPVVNVNVAQSAARAFIGGEVLNPGFVPLTKPMTTLQAVIERGGFLPTASLSDIIVISHAEGQPIARRLDLTEQMESGTMDGTLLSPDEVVLIPKTGIAKANQFVQQFMNNMTPTIVRQLRFGTVDVIGSGN
jgi:polysaccharide export outer membrane protein